MAPIKFALPLVVLGLSACGNVETAEPVNWTSTLHTEHPLVGRIWSSADNEFIDAGELLAEAANSRYLLLGEKHDNPDHHTLQLMVINYLVQEGKLAAVALEMMGVGRQGALDTVQEQGFATADEIKDYLQWDAAGWDWSFYGPLVEASIAAGIPLYAANIDDDTLLDVYGGDLAQEIADIPDAAVIERLQLDIDESHCGMLPASQFPAMVRVQQSRDHQMAMALRNGNAAAGSGVTVLIAGNYHVREDLGVPVYLRALQNTLAPEAITSLSFSEVDPASTDPADYLQQFSGTRAYDYIWFTPAISDEDYCASLRESQ